MEWPRRGFWSRISAGLRSAGGSKSTRGAGLRAPALGGCMKAASSTTTWTLTILTSVALAGGLAWGRQGGTAEHERHRSLLRLPWKEAGLTERQAAAHLLNRFAFGPRPGEIDQVVAKI